MMRKLIELTIHFSICKFSFSRPILFITLSTQFEIFIHFLFIYLFVFFFYFSSLNLSVIIKYIVIDDFRPSSYRFNLIIFTSSREKIKKKIITAFHLKSNFAPFTRNFREKKMSLSLPPPPPFSTFQYEPILWIFTHLQISGEFLAILLYGCIRQISEPTKCCLCFLPGILFCRVRCRVDTGT